MSWIRHRRPNFSPIFPDFPRFSTSLPRQILHKRPRTCSTHGTHVLVPTPRSRIPPSITGLMRHHPAPITCLHSRPRFWTLGPRPLSIIPTISTRFRLLPISYHCSKFSHWATYTIALLLLSPHRFCLIPIRFSYCPVMVDLLFLLFPFVLFSDNASRNVHCPATYINPSCSAA